MAAGLGRSLYFSGLSSVVGVAVQFGLSVIVARLLTPTEIGSFGVAMGASALIRAFESAGVNNFVASYKDLTPSLMRTVFTANMGLNLMLALVLLLLAYPAGAFYESEMVTSLIQLLALAVVLNTHMPLLQGILRRDMRFGALMGFNIYVLAVTTVTTVVAVLMGFGALSLAFAVVAERLAAIAAGLTLFRDRVPVAIRFADMRKVLNYGVPLSLATVIGIMGANANNFILGRVMGLAHSAQFDRGFTLPRLVAGVALPSFHSVLVPEVARRQREGGDHRQAVVDVTRAFALLVWPAGLVLSLVSPEAVLLLFGPQWQEAAMVAPFLMLYIVIVSPFNLATSPMVTFGYGKHLIMLTTVENTVKVAVLLMAGVLGMQGLAYAMCLPWLAYILLAVTFLIRLDLIVPGAFFRAFIGPLRLCALSLVPALAMYGLKGFHTFLDLPDLLLVAAGSAVFYLAGLWLWERDFLDKALVLLKVKRA
ncbi:MAG: hypothetical protein EP335_09650 [Alphaproteobacteria bacterium]|nr:MAG: hypothetical protein EP335_09650 [Alphaproteobacteria bacterium]